MSVSVIWVILKLIVERNAFPQEKFCDLLTKWEKIHKTQTDSSLRVQFMIKKRLFTNPLVVSTNETEEQLLMFQVLEDILHDRYPSTPEDAIYFTALRCQSDHGDFLPAKQIEY